jgi:branched-chain amino acid transport system ATP-binding protein
MVHQGKGLNFLTRAKHIAREETLSILENVGLADKAEALGGELAHGDQKQLELGIVLAGEPQLLLLDEPTSGMSPAETVRAMELIATIARQRALTLLFTEHDMEVVFAISERVTVMHQGQVIAQGTPQEVRANEEVQKIYLGERA